MSAEPDRPPPMPPSAWRQIVDSAIDTAIIAIDPAGRVTTWSRGAERILGWTATEMQGQTLDRLFDDEDRLAGRFASEMADALAHGKGGGVEGWRVRRDGSRFWGAGETTPMHDEDGRHLGFVKVLRDRSVARRAEERLVEERRALEVLNRAGSALAAETDLARLVQIVTDAGVELTGAEFGAFFYNLVDDHGERYMLYALSGAAPEAFARFPMPRITAVFAPTFEGHGIVRSDDITRDPRYGREAPHRGMPPGHLPVRSYLAVPVVSRTNHVIGALMFGHGRPGRFDDDSERGLTGLAAEAAVAIDNARLAMASERELAERRRAEEALRDLNATLEQQVAERTAELQRKADALRQSQKMEAVGQLTGGIAHDFNNLLQVIVGNLEVVRRTLPAPEARLLRAVDGAMSGARRAASLTQRLLAFARRQPLDPRPLDVNELVLGLADMLHRALGETIALETALDADAWPTEVDASELESAILNLAVNARDAMAHGGALVIATSNAVVNAEEAGSHPELVAGEYVVIAVSDTGSGMDEGTLAQAFEPFFTTKPVGQGTGLGLSQVYGFVRQSGGHVRLVSRPGAGTTVRLALPRLAAGRAVAGCPDEPVAAPGIALETVLVVEDDADVRAQSAHSLRELGYRVLEAADGPEALRLLGGSDHVDLLFTDVVLPGGLTGAELAARAGVGRPSMRVLFTSGYSRDAITRDGRLDAGVQLLSKPYTFGALASRLRDVLDAPDADGASLR